MSNFERIDKVIEVLSTLTVREAKYFIKETGCDPRLLLQACKASDGRSYIGYRIDTNRNTDVRKRIQAIKSIRTVLDFGLKEAKEATEGSLIQATPEEVSELRKMLEPCGYIISKVYG